MDEEEVEERKKYMGTTDHFNSRKQGVINEVGRQNMARLLTPQLYRRVPPDRFFHDDARAQEQHRFLPSPCPSLI